jgi:hypothetical protein
LIKSLLRLILAPENAAMMGITRGFASGENYYHRERYRKTSHIINSDQILV